MIDITEIIVAVIGLISAAIGALLVPYINSKWSAEKQNNLAYWVDVAVSAAEGIFTASKSGADKYEYVIEFLEQKGLYFDEAEVAALIESTVYNTINKFKYKETEEYTATTE